MTKAIIRQKPRVLSLKADENGVNWMKSSVRIKKIRTYFGLPLLMAELVNLFPTFALYFSNADEVALSETVGAFVMIVVFVFGVFLLCVMITRIPIYAGFASMLVSFVLLYYFVLERIVKAVFPWMKCWHVFPLMLFVAGTVISLFCFFFPEQIEDYICKAVCVVFGTMILINGVVKAPSIIRKTTNDRQIAMNDGERKDIVGGGSGKTTNFYIVLFDEYAGFKQIKEGYEYDNAELERFLLRNGFNISYDSYNESIETTIVVTNMVNCEYVVDNDTPDSDRELIRKNGAIYDLMRNHGYKSQILETGDFLGQYSPVRNDSGDNKAQTATGETFLDICVQNSFVGIWTRKRFASSISDILKLRDYVIEMDKPKENTMTFIYFKFPHAPFFVDENGYPNNYYKFSDWQDKSMYLGQYKYATKIMMDIVSALIEKDPDSVIYLCSDHGARAAGDDTLFMKGYYSLEYSENPLCAVYFKGKDYSKINGASGVNVIRMILNDIIGTDYEELDVPNGTYK